MTSPATMMIAEPVGSMIVPLSSPIPPVTLRAMGAPWAPGLLAAMVTLALLILAARLVARSRPRRRTFTRTASAERAASDTSSALATSSSRIAS